MPIIPSFEERYALKPFILLDDSLLAYNKPNDKHSSWSYTRIGYSFWKNFIPESELIEKIVADPVIFFPLTKYVVSASARAATSDDECIEVLCNDRIYVILADLFYASVRTQDIFSLADLLDPNFKGTTLGTRARLVRDLLLAKQNQE